MTTTFATVPRWIAAVALALAGCADDPAIATSDDALTLPADALPAPAVSIGFDDCRAGRARDDASGAYAALHGRGLCSAGRFHGALDLDGNDRAEVADRADLQATTAVSLAAWVQPRRVTGTATIASKWYAPDSYALGIQDGQYTFSVAFPGGAWGRTVTVRTAATANRWTHVVGTYDGSRVRIYLDGRLAASAAATGTLQASTRPLTIGNHPAWNGFDGRLDEIRVYGQALSAPQVAQLARGEVHVVRAFYVRPRDLADRPEYDAAIDAYMDELRAWYRAEAGVSFRYVGVTEIVGGDFATMRCGAAPTPACAADRTQLPAWWGSVWNAVAAAGGHRAREVTLVFAQGGGGYVGANLINDDQGYAVVGDWVLEPIAGVRDPAANHCGYADWQCAPDVARGTVAHEIGHAFGLHHPDGYPGNSIMAWHGGYPDKDFLDHELTLLRLSPFLSAGVRTPDAPFAEYGTTDVMRHGESHTVFGLRFGAAPRVQLVDAAGVTTVTPTASGDSHVTFTVPAGIGPGLVRVVRGDVIGNAVPVNVYP